MAFLLTPSYAADPVRLTVRSAPGQLRIIGVWQALGQHASHARRSHIHCSGKRNFDELTVTLDCVSPAELGDIMLLLNAQPWVIAASITESQYAVGPSRQGPLNRRTLERPAA